MRDEKLDEFNQTIQEKDDLIETLQQQIQTDQADCPCRPG